MDFNPGSMPVLGVAPLGQSLNACEGGEGRGSPGLKRVKTALGGRKVMALPPGFNSLIQEEGDVLVNHAFRKKRKKHERYTAAVVKYELMASELEEGKKVDYRSISHYELVYACVEQEFDKESAVYKTLASCCAKGFEFDGTFADFTACVKQINPHMPQDTVLAVLERDSWKGLVASNVLNTKHKFMVLVLCCLPRRTFWEENGIARQIMLRGWSQSRKNAYGRVPRNVSAFIGKFYKLRGNSHKMFNLVLSRQSFNDIDPRLWGPNMTIRLLIIFQQGHDEVFTSDSWLRLMKKVLDPNVRLSANFLAFKLQNENWINDTSGRAYVDWLPPERITKVPETLRVGKIEQMRREASRMARAVDLNYSGLPQLLKDEISSTKDPQAKLRALEDLGLKAKGLLLHLFKLRQHFERRFALAKKLNHHAYVQFCIEGSQHFNPTIEFWHHVLVEYCGYSSLRSVASLKETLPVASLSKANTQDLRGSCSSAGPLDKLPDEASHMQVHKVPGVARRPTGDLYARTSLQEYRAAVDLKAVQAANVANNLSRIVNEMLVFIGSFESIKPDRQSIELFRLMLNVYSRQIESIRQETQWCHKT